MVKRKKRLKKGIDSLARQVNLHEAKLKKAEQEEKTELAAYYQKEIISKQADIEKKRRLLKKQ